MKRETLENAIMALDQLLARSGMPEGDYQSLFELHPVILETLGYTRAVPRPRLPLKSGGWLEPDFLAQLASGLWEILDLKTPDERILLSRSRRNTFDALMASYIAQVDEYREYFDDSAHRQACVEKLGIDVHADPDTVLVVGRDATVDVVEVHRHCRRRSPRLDVVTFDQVLAALMRSHAAQFGGLEDLAGLTSFTLLRLNPLPEARRKYVTEVWGPSGAAVGVFLDERDRLALEVHDSTGNVHVAHADFDPATLFDHWLVLSSEVGSGSDGSVLQVRVDDRIGASLVLPTTLLGLSPDSGSVGADRTELLGARIDIAEHLLYDRILTFRERHQLLRYLSEKADTTIAAWVEYNGTQCQTFDSHSGNRDLTQANPSRRPTFRRPGGH